ncbi:MAG: glycosyltransferase [Acidobacteriota bacterium]
MRVMIASEHRYPAAVGGRSGARLYDNLAKGLAELGHHVYYYLEDGAAIALPPGVDLVSGPIWDADVWQLSREDPLSNEADVRGQPWLRTCHVDMDLMVKDRAQARDNWIFVSRTLAEAYGRQRYVLNGIDPAEFLFSQEKEDYILFAMGSAEWGRAKGLDIALDLAAELDLRLLVAGSGSCNRYLSTVRAHCERHGAHWVGEHYGTQRAKLYAGASALLFPTQINESFGLVIAECLMSGTPVVTSDRGACPELVTPEVGFVCSKRDEYLTALQNVHTIDPRACRDRAMAAFHYKTMAEGYVREYERELAAD